LQGGEEIPHLYCPFLFLYCAFLDGFQPVAETRVPPPHLVVLYGDLDGRARAHQHDQPFGARDGGVEQVALQHHVMLR